MFKRFQWHSAAPHFTLLAEGAFVRVAHWLVLDSVLFSSQLYQRCGLLFWPVQCKTNALPCLQFFLLEMAIIITHAESRAVAERHSSSGFDLHLQGVSAVP